MLTGAGHKGEGEERRQAGRTHCWRGSGEPRPAWSSPPAAAAAAPSAAGCLRSRPQWRGAARRGTRTPPSSSSDGGREQQQHPLRSDPLRPPSDPASTPPPAGQTRGLHNAPSRPNKWSSQQNRRFLEHPGNKIWPLFRIVLHINNFIYLSLLLINTIIQWIRKPCTVKPSSQ